MGRGTSAHKLVALQGGGDLIGHSIITRTSTNPVGAEDFSHATQADGERSAVVESDYVLDRHAKIRLSLRDEQDASGTDVLCITTEDYAFNAGTCNRERKLQLETPGSSLFHVNGD